jgi:hypothetical protein
MEAGAEQIRITQLSNILKEGQWILLWLSNVKRITNYEQFEINATFAPLIANPNGSPDSISSYNTKLIKIISLGVGLLPVLELGSIWENGRCIKHAKEYAKEISIVVNNPCNAPIEVIRNCINLPTKYYFFYREHYETPCILLRNRIDFESYESEFIIIPCNEIARFYYCRSSPLSIKLINGGLSRNELFDPLWEPNPEDPDLTIKEFADGKVYLLLEKEMLDRDVGCLARIAYDSNAAKGAMMIYNSLQINHLGNLPAFLRTNFPFESPTTLKMVGKKINVDGYWGMLIYSISSCTGAFPFTELEFKRKNDGTKGENLDNAVPVNNPRKTPSQTDGSIHIDANQHADSHTLPITINIQEEEDPFPGLPANIYKSKKIDQKWINTAKPILHTVNPDLFTPELIGEDNPGVAKANLQTSDESEYVELLDEEKRRNFFNRFRESILELGKLKDVGIKFIKLNDYRPIQNSNFVSSFVSTNIKEPDQKNWCYVKYLSQKKKWVIRRRLIVAEVTFGTNFFYFFEIEPRYIDSSFPIYMISTITYSALLISDIESLLEFCIKNKGSWPSGGMLTNYKSIRFDHEHEKTPELIAQKYFKKLKSQVKASNIKI